MSKLSIASFLGGIIITSVIFVILINIAVKKSEKIISMWSNKEWTECVKQMNDIYYGQISMEVFENNARFIRQLPAGWVTFYFKPYNFFKFYE